MSADTRLIVGTVVATGIVVAVAVGTVLGSQILHNGTEIRNLAPRMDDERDDLFVAV